MFLCRRKAATRVESCRCAIDDERARRAHAEPHLKRTLKRERAAGKDTFARGIVGVAEPQRVVSSHLSGKVCESARAAGNVAGKERTGERPVAACLRQRGGRLGAGDLDLFAVQRALEIEVARVEADVAEGRACVVRHVRGVCGGVGEGKLRRRAAVFRLPVGVVADVAARSVEPYAVGCERRRGHHRKNQDCKIVERRSGDSHACPQRLVQHTMLLAYKP